ncbi:MAG TPA: hypothetical protein PK659_02280 [Methanothrix sp.]|nr:hypothetical protein [Methanothrix sp.]HOK57665.1 hypothetical protein [Methanothrix sp.]HOL43068.1 hypothetical protein [Methanothrix sp.]HPO88070.1 hypothetical protein [Methanothrix sp.]
MEELPAFTYWGIADIRLLALFVDFFFSFIERTRNEEVFTTIMR